MLIQHYYCAAVGKVNKVGDDYLGLLVMGVFNAAIAADQIRREFKCHSEVGCCDMQLATCTASQ